MITPQQHLIIRWMRDEYSYAFTVTKNIPRLKELIQMGDFLMKRSDMPEDRKWVEAGLVDLKYELSLE